PDQRAPRPVTLHDTGGRRAIQPANSGAGLMTLGLITSKKRLVYPGFDDITLGPLMQPWRGLWQGLLGGNEEFHSK
ncbi:MAG: hypothetical protein ACRD22_02115, partial [Terriglobia bacterium]